MEPRPVPIRQPSARSGGSVTATPRPVTGYFHSEAVPIPDPLLETLNDNCKRV